MSVSTFIWHPDLGAQKRLEVAVTETQFGDGYSQRAPNGINHVREVWSVSFTGNDTDIAPIKGFLEAVIAVTPFKWMTPEEKEILVVAKNFKLDRSKQGIRKIDCEFWQDFDFAS